MTVSEPVMSTINLTDNGEPDTPVFNQDDPPTLSICSPEKTEKAERVVYQGARRGG